MIVKKSAPHLPGRRVILYLALLLVAGLSLVTLAQAAAAQSAAAVTYYIATNGNDSAAGTSTASAWRTFGRAWQTLQAGDTLLVLDGTYTEAIQPAVRSGQAGAPITVRALNDGKVTIDGQGQRVPIRLDLNWYVVEGIVGRNGAIAVARIEGDNNVLRRVSAYNADTNDNSSIIFIWGDGNLLEDVAAAGTGRYAIEVYQGNNNTLRRVFAKWEGWDGRGFCGVAWPNGYNIGVYNASNTTVENAIAYGRAPSAGIMVQANADNAVADNNQVLGSMSLLAGRDYNGSVWTYGTGQEQPTSRPATTTNPPCNTNITQWSWGGQRVGFLLYGQGALRNNVFRDVLATGSMGIGFESGKPYGVGDSNTTLDHATFYNNGAGAVGWDTAQGGNIMLGTSGVQNVTNSRIDNSSIPVGEGARFGNRYVNRTLTGEPLLPWPMEARIQSEAGLSINALVTSVVQQGGGSITPVPTATPGAPTATPGAPTATPVAPSPTPVASATPVATATPEPDNNGVRMSVAVNAYAMLRNGSVTLRVKVDTPDSSSKPITISITDATSGLNISPANATVNTPGEATFKVTTASNPRRGELHQLTITGHTDGLNDARQTLSIIVDPIPLFLPMINKAR